MNPNPNRNCEFGADFERALDVLEQGGVVAAATETFFGLLADAARPDALDRLENVKRRGREKGLPLILSSEVAWSELVVEIPEAARRLAERFWPGPLSIALPARSDLDPRIVLDGSVAVRIPTACDAGELARRFGRTLTATSANLPGEPPQTEGVAVFRIFERAELPLFVLNGRSPGGLPSTVVVLGARGWSFARAGAAPLDDVRSVLVSSGAEPATGGPSA